MVVVVVLLQVMSTWFTACVIEIETFRTAVIVVDTLTFKAAVHQFKIHFRYVHASNTIRNFILVLLGSTLQNLILTKNEQPY